MYMPEIGRWGVLDPLLEEARSVSPYSYAYNNPVSLLDYEGMAVGDPIASNYSGTGNVLIIFADEPDSNWDTESLSNTGWDYVIVTNFADAESWVNSTYGKSGIGIDNLAIRSHGSNQNGGMMVVPNGQGSFNTISSDDLNSGKDENSAALISIGSRLNNNATVLLTGCNISHKSTKFASTLFSKLDGEKKNLTLYTNNASTHATDQKTRRGKTTNSARIGKPLVLQGKRWDSWIRTDKNGSTILPRGSSMQLNKDGSIGEIDMPIPFKPRVSPTKKPCFGCYDTPPPWLPQKTNSM